MRKISSTDAPRFAEPQQAPAKRRDTRDQRGFIAAATGALVAAAQFTGAAGVSPSPASQLPLPAGNLSTVMAPPHAAPWPAPALAPQALLGVPQASGALSPVPSWTTQPLAVASVPSWSTQPLTLAHNRLHTADGRPFVPVAVNTVGFDNCGSGDISLNATKELYRFATTHGINMLVVDINLTKDWLKKPKLTDNLLELVDFVGHELPGTYVILRPLGDGASLFKDDLMDSRGATSVQSRSYLEGLAARLRGKPQALVAVAKELHWNRDDKVNNVTINDTNAALRSNLESAVRGMQAVNPDLMLVVPALVSSQNEAWSRSLEGWRGHFNLTHTLIGADLYTTLGANQTAQAARWREGEDELPVLYTEIAAMNDTATQAVMSRETVEAVVLDAARKGIGSAFWVLAQEKECAPGMLTYRPDAPQGLVLNDWGNFTMGLVQKIRAQLGMADLSGK